MTFTYPLLTDGKVDKSVLPEEGAQGINASAFGVSTTATDNTDAFTAIANKYKSLEEQTVVDLPGGVLRGRLPMAPGLVWRFNGTTLKFPTSGPTGHLVHPLDDAWWGATGDNGAPGAHRSGLIGTGIIDGESQLWGLDPLPRAPKPTVTDAGDGPLGRGTYLYRIAYVNEFGHGLPSTGGQFEVTVDGDGYAAPRSLKLEWTNTNNDAEIIVFGRDPATRWRQRPLARLAPGTTEWVDWGTETPEGMPCRHIDISAPSNVICGASFLVDGLTIQNMPGTSLAVRFDGETPEGEERQLMEARLSHLKIRRSGAEGITFCGPHDTSISDVTVADTGKHAADDNRAPRAAILIADNGPVVIRNSHTWGFCSWGLESMYRTDVFDSIFEGGSEGQVWLQDEAKVNGMEVFYPQSSSAVGLRVGLEWNKPQVQVEGFKARMFGADSGAAMDLRYADTRSGFKGVIYQHDGTPIIDGNNLRVDVEVIGDSNGEGLRSRIDRAVTVLDYGAVPGTDCTDAFQAAVDDAGAVGGRIVIPAASEPYQIKAKYLGAKNPYGVWYAAVQLKSNIHLDFEAGARVQAITVKNSNGQYTPQALFYLEKAHNVTISGLHAYGDTTEFLNLNKVVVVANYRSKNLLVTDLEADGVSETISVKGTVDRGSDDTAMDNMFLRCTIGPNIGAGFHLFGQHVRTRVIDYRVKGTLKYDALQLEPVLNDGGAGEDYRVASKDFVGRRITVESSCYRGIFINPLNDNFLLEDIIVRNVGRMPDGTTIVGYDQQEKDRLVTNSALTIIESTGTVRNASLHDAIDMDPATNPDISSWAEKTYGHGIEIRTPLDLRFEGRLDLQNNASGDVGITNQAGWRDQIKGVVFDTDYIPEIDYAEPTKYVPPVTAGGSGSYAIKPISLLNCWNLVGPDGQANRRFKRRNDIQTEVTDSLVGASVGGSLRITGAAAADGTENPKPIISIRSDKRMRLAKGQAVHLLMIARFNLPSNTFAWSFGDKESLRQEMWPAIEGRGYEQGKVQFVHRPWVLDKETVWGGDWLTLWPRYGSTEPLDIEIEGIWLYAGARTFTPEFDFGGELVTHDRPIEGNGSWGQGERLQIDHPIAGGHTHWVCVGDGQPGTWRKAGAIELDL